MEEATPVKTRRKYNKRALDETVIPTVQDLLARMEPGQRYSLKGVRRLLRTTLPNAQMTVSNALNEQRIRKTIARSEAQFWLPTAAELDASRRNQERVSMLPTGSLSGYDATHRTFRDLCMLTRR